MHRPLGQMAAPSWPAVWVTGGPDMPWAVSSLLLGGLGTGVAPHALLGVRSCSGPTAYSRPMARPCWGMRQPRLSSAPGPMRPASLPPSGVGVPEPLCWSVAPSPLLAASPAPGSSAHTAQPSPRLCVDTWVLLLPTLLPSGGPVQGQLPPQNGFSPKDLSPWFLGDRPLSSSSSLPHPHALSHNTGTVSPHWWPPLGPWPLPVTHQKLGTGSSP